MNGEISKQLNLPIIGGEITAYYSRNSFFLVFTLVFPGPNARYNSGIVKLNSSQFEVFVENLEIALAKMEKLEFVSLPGTYSEQIGVRRTPLLKVISENKKLFLEIGVSSDSHTFHRRLNKENTKNLINRAKRVPEVGLSLTRSLKRLNS